MTIDHESGPNPEVEVFWTAWDLCEKRCLRRIRRHESLTAQIGGRGAEFTLFCAVVAKFDSRLKGVYPEVCMGPSRPSRISIGCCLRSFQRQTRDFVVPKSIPIGWGALILLRSFPLLSQKTVAAAILFHVLLAG